MVDSRKLSELFVKHVQLEAGRQTKLNVYDTQNNLQIQEALNPYLLAYDPNGELPHNAIDPIYRSLTKYEDVLALGPYNWLNYLPFFLADKENVFLITPPMDNPIVIEFLRGWDMRFLFRENHRLPSFDFYIGDKYGKFLFYCDEDLNLYGWGEAKTWLENYKQSTSINIYELLQKPPKPISIVDLKVEEWGKKLLFDAIYDLDGEALAFVMIFSGCDIESWQTRFNSKMRFETLFPEEVRLQQAVEQTGYALPASVETAMFRIHFYYQNLEVKLRGDTLP